MKNIESSVEHPPGNNIPVIYPLKRLLYSRKVMVAALALLVTLASELGLSAEIVNTFNTMALAVIAAWTAKDVSANLGK